MGMISKKIEQEANAIETLPDGNLNTASVIIRGIWNLIIKISDLSCISILFTFSTELAIVLSD